MFQNVVIGKPLVEPWKLISETEEEFNKFDKRETLFTEERFLPSILVESGVTTSRSEVRRNRQDLWIDLNDVDCLNIKFGKKRLFIIVGE